MFCWVKNQRLMRYDFKYNIITSEGKSQITIFNYFLTGLTTLTNCLAKEATHVFDVEIPERIDDKTVFKEFSDQLKLNKPKKGRKGKGKGKKKKK